MRPDLSASPAPGSTSAPGGIHYLCSLYLCWPPSPGMWACLDFGIWSLTAIIYKMGAAEVPVALLLRGGCEKGLCGQ